MSQHLIITVRLEKKKKKKLSSITMYGFVSGTPEVAACDRATYYSPLQVVERGGRTRGEVARAAAVLDGVGLRLPCGGTGLHELADLVVHRRADVGGGAQVAAGEGAVGSGKLEHAGRHKTGAEGQVHLDRARARARVRVRVWVSNLGSDSGSGSGSGSGSDSGSGSGSGWSWG